IQRHLSKSAGSTVAAGIQGVRKETIGGALEKTQGTVNGRALHVSPSLDARRNRLPGGQPMKVPFDFSGKFLATICFVLLSVFSIDVADAQVTSGTIVGTISDPSGAPLPGVRVVITDIHKNESREYTTDETGGFNAPFLIPGTYRVTAEKAG